MATCNPSTLLSDGKAFQALSSRGLQLAIVQLLCDLSTGGTGGVSSGVGTPSSTPTGAAIYVDTATNALYSWDGAQWDTLIAP